MLSAIRLFVAYVLVVAMAVIPIDGCNWVGGRWATCYYVDQWGYSVAISSPHGNVVGMTGCFPWSRADTSTGIWRCIEK